MKPLPSAIGLALACATCAALTTTSAWAGRPLGTDDAGAAALGTCQVEAWVERQPGNQRTWVASPACGVAPGVELGLELAWPRPLQGVRMGASPAMKWAPEWAALATPFGTLNLGLKLAAAYELPTADGAWHHTDARGLLLATLVPSDTLTVHANLGRLRDRSTGASLGAGVLNLALQWTPLDPLLLFAEASSTNRRDLFGPTVQTVGGRWWLLKDRLGLDVTASREAGASGAPGITWTLGLGAYGISF